MKKNKIENKMCIEETTTHRPLLTKKIVKKRYHAAAIEREKENGRELDTIFN